MIRPMEFPFFIYDGNIISKNEPLKAGCLLNRGLYYGDGFFDTQFIEVGKHIRNWEFHRKRLLESFRYMGLNIIEDVVFADKYRLLVEALLQKNDVQSSLKNIILRLQVWRKGGRGYFSDSKEASFLIECFEVPIQVEEKAVKSFQTPMSLRAGLSSTLKSSSSYPYVNIANETMGEAIILTDIDEHLLEGLNTSLFWINGDTLYAPKQTSELLVGVSRMALIQTCIDMGYSFKEHLLHSQEVHSQDVLFMTNAVNPFCVINEWNDEHLEIEPTFFNKLKEAFLETINRYSLELSC